MGYRQGAGRPVIQSGHAISGCDSGRSHADEGAFKATSTGNLPVKVVKKASALLPGFAVSRFDTSISISEFAGSNEGKFLALHYTRILAEAAGIIYQKGGLYHLKKTAQKQYQSQGIQAFFKPMLEAAVTKYNWKYMDGWEDDIDLRTFWLFMLWRIQAHGDFDRMAEEVATAFPALLAMQVTGSPFSTQETLGHLIKLRFVERFLQYWGFVTMDQKRYINDKTVPFKVQVLPLMEAVFEFSV